MNIKRMSLLVFVFSIILMVSFNIIAFANEDNSINSIFTNNDENEFDDGIPEVTMDDVSNWVDKKGFEIISVLQRFVQPFAIIIFIGCAILALIGAFGNNKLISNGILGMGISLVVYGIVLYAPEIMDGFLAWVRN